MTLSEIERDAARCGYRRLPKRAATVLREVDAPPRLLAHHILVHDVVCQLLDVLGPVLPESVDKTVVCFGAATHDIGKAVYPTELSAPGKTHEEAGRALLIKHGVGDALARFAVTHGLSSETGLLGIEDLLVVLADKCWKGKRVHSIEERLARDLARDSDRDFFDLLLLVSDLAESIANHASQRLHWQNKHPSRD